MQLNEVKPYKHKMKIETLICFLVGSLIFAPGASGDLRRYNKDDGLQCNLFNACAHAQDASGKMYFGGTNGIEVFHPDKMPVNTDTVKPAWYRSTATRIIFAILVLGALASLTRWFLKHTETVKAKEIAQITKTYEEKVQNLTGKTPVELIKTMRMKRACELMKETDLSIADIAEQTGFQTPGYFITVFKNHFGETPGHYASRVRQQ